MFSYRLLFPATAAAAALFAVCPIAAFAQNVPAPEYDAKAEAVLQNAASRMQAAQALSGQVQMIVNIPASGAIPAHESRFVTAFWMQRPNKAVQEISVQQKNADGSWTTTPYSKSVSDGKTGALFSLPRKIYRKLQTTPEAVGSTYGLNFPEFFVPALSDAQRVRDAKASGLLVSLQMAGDETFAGVPCTVVQEKMRTSKTDAAKAYTKKIYIGKNDGLIRGYHREVLSQNGGQTQTTDLTLTDVAVRDEIPASVFAVNFTGYKEYGVPAPAATAPAKHPALLAAGTLAPDFTAYDKNGNTVKLSDFKGKIVVLDFWATWCGPCMKSFPGTSTVATEKAEKGVVVLAVNVWDKKEAFNNWLPQHPEYAPIQFVIDITPGKGQDIATKQYRVWGIPTQYVIDRNGKIAASLIYRPAAELEAAIAKADANGTSVAQK